MSTHSTLLQKESNLLHYSNFFFLNPIHGIEGVQMDLIPKLRHLSLFLVLVY